MPAFDPPRADEAHVSIEVDRSIIREAGAVGGFEDDPVGRGNIWIGPSNLIEGPFPPGRYSLTVRNSTVEGARVFGVGMGNIGSKLGLPSDQSRIGVLLRDNNISGNGRAEVMVSTPNAQIDARENFWGAAEGLGKDRVLVFDQARRSQVDASQHRTTARANPQ